jgi:hypothetical protein
MSLADAEASVVFCGGSTYIFRMCFACCLAFHGDLKNPELCGFEF